MVVFVSHFSAENVTSYYRKKLAWILLWMLMRLTSSTQKFHEKLCQGYLGPLTSRGATIGSSAVMNSILQTTKDGAKSFTRKLLS